MGIILSTLRKLFKRKTEGLPAALQPSTSGSYALQDLTHVKIEPNPTTTGVPSPPVLADPPGLSEAATTSLSSATPAAQVMTGPGPSQVSEGSSTTHSHPQTDPAAAQVTNIHAPASNNPRPNSACSSQFIAPALQPSKTFPSPSGLKGGPPKPLTLWGEAVERLRKETPGVLVEKKENFQFATSLIDYIRDQRGKSDESRLQYTNSKNEKVYYGEVLLTQLEKYAKFGDIALQHHPDVVALAWSGFRLLLDLGLAYYKRMALISASLGYLAWVIHCSAIYEALYVETKQQSVTELRTRLVDQYVSILSYLIYAKQHVDKSAPKQILESLSTHLSRLLEDVRSCEKCTRECADLMEKEAASNHRSRADASREKLKAQLEECKSQLQGLESSLKDCHMRLGVICDYIDELKLKDALNWISKLEYGANHRTHCERRMPNTCEWLERNEEFKEWLNFGSSSSAFWLCGDAGTGKSHLTSKVVDILINGTNQDPDNENSFVGNSAVAFFYCSYDLPQHSNPSSVLRAIVRQLCLAYSSGLPKSIMKLYEQRSLNSGGSLTLEESKRYIIELSKDFSDGVWIIIDALDELDSATRMEFFHVLNDILVAVKTVRMFFSSRNESDIKSRMSAYSQHYIRPEDNSGDIRAYLDEKIEDLYLKSRGMRDYLETQRSKINTLDTDANGMFLAVSLRIEELGRQVTQDGIDDTLRYNPQSLEEKYRNILHRIGKHTKTNNRNALNVIHWLYNTIDDRSPEILLQSLQIATDPRQDTSVPYSKINSIDDLYAICCGLVVLDKSTGVLRFSHATVKEFLDQSSEYNKDEGRRWIADVCRQVLTNPMYGAYDNLSDIDDPNIHNIIVYPKLLIHYATRNWGHHLSTLITKSSLNPQQWNGLLDPQSDVYRSWASSLRITLPYLSGMDTSNTSLLWTACYYRLLPTFRECLKDSGQLQVSDPNLCNQTGRTPLHHSAEHGDMEYVQLLLDHSNTNLNCRDMSMNTPLILAVQSKQMRVVLSLIARPAVDINHADLEGRTALMHALLAGDSAIFRKLLRTGRCDLSLSDLNGDTILHYAASKGSELEVKYILQAISAQTLNHQNWSGETALSLATIGGYVGIVECILKASDDVLPNTANARGEAPLFIAARLKHFDLLKALIADPRVDINKRYWSETLLIMAAKSDQYQVIRLLLTRKDLDVNETSGSYGWTALSHAVMGGHLESVKLLVKAQGMNTQHKDSDGDTVLMLAVLQGNTSIVEALLEERCLDITIPNKRGITPLMAALEHEYPEISDILVRRSEKGALDEIDDDGATPLLLAAQAGMSSSVQSILERGGFEINHRDNNGYTAFANAAASGNSEIVEMLLEQDGIDISTATRDRSTPLLLAAKFGSSRSVRLILARRGFDINHRDDRGYTALANAAARGDSEIVEMLLEQDGIDVSTTTRDGSTPLLLAARSRDPRSVRLILPRGGFDINHRDDRGFTAFANAATSGNPEIVEMLSEQDGIDVSAVTECGNTPLLLAVNSGNPRCLQLILDRRGCDINHRDGRQCTALMVAAQGGHTELVKILLKEEGIQLKTAHNHGTTPLLLAAEYGHVEIFEMLLDRYDEADELLEMDADDDTILILGSKSGKPRIVELALKRGKHNVNHRNKEGNTGLLQAATLGHTEVVDMLLREDGIDVSITNNHGVSAFDLAKEDGDEGIMTLLAPFLPREG